MKVYCITYFNNPMLNLQQLNHCLKTLTAYRYIKFGNQKEVRSTLIGYTTLDTLFNHTHVEDYPLEEIALLLINAGGYFRYHPEYSLLARWPKLFAAYAKRNI